MKKRKNRIIAIILSALLVFSMAGAVWADGDVDPSEGSGAEMTNTDAGSLEGTDGNAVVDEVGDGGVQENDANINNDVNDGVAEGNDVQTGSAGGSDDQNSGAEGGDDRNSGSESGAVQNSGAEGGDAQNSSTEGGDVQNSGIEGNDAQNSGAEGGDVQNSSTEGGNTQNSGTEVGDSQNSGTKDGNAQNSGMNNGETGEGVAQSSDVPNGDIKNDETKTGEIKTDETKTGEIKTDETKTEDTKTEGGEAKTGDTKTDETKTEDSTDEKSKDEDKDKDKDKDEEEPEIFSLTETFTESEDIPTEAIGMDPQTMMDNVLTLGPQTDPGIGRRTIPMLFASSYNGNKLADLNGLTYNALKSMVIEVAAGRQNSTKLDTVFSGGQISGHRWTAADLGMELYTTDSSNNKHVNEAAAAAAMNQIYDSVTVVRSVIRDCPYEMFWFGNQYYMNRTYTVNVDYNSEKKEYELSFSSLHVMINLSVSTDYRAGDEYVTDTAKIQSVSSAMTNARNIINAASGMGDMEKLDYFRQQICNLVSYNYSTGSGDYGNPWQLIYVFDNDPSTNVVCEGYAKAFQYLCDESSFGAGDFAVYSVAGGFQTNNGASQGHLWNIVRMNGKNYLADVTNCDGASSSAKLFMVRASSGSVNDGYVFQAGSASYKYTYYDYTRDLYADSELEMMDPPAQPQTQPQTTPQTQPQTTPQAQPQTQPQTAPQAQPQTQPQTTPQAQPKPTVHTHSWDSGKVVKNATCTAAGTKQYTCTGCGQTRTESIPAAGHKPKVTASAVEATYFREGKTEEKRCSVCNTVLTASQKIPMKELGRLLVREMTGDDVKQVQQALLDLGYDVEVADGYFGSVTEKAVLQFQQDAGAYADGEVGGVTMGYLRDRLTVSSSSAGSGSGSSGSGSSGSGSSGSAGAVPSLARTLSHGTEGSDVNVMQQMLARLGYSISVDGLFGSQTEEVVKQFQQDYSLYVDGIVGSVTYGKLVELTGSSVSDSGSGNANTGAASGNTNSGSGSGNISLSRSLSVGMTGDDVREVQQKLQDLGYDIAVDGVFGVMTQATVMSYQSYYGLVVDGIVGSQTVESLNSR